MRENRSCGFVRGAVSDGRPYRDRGVLSDWYPYHDTGASKCLSGSANGFFRNLP
jgi:hypothetical protein